LRECFLYAGLGEEGAPAEALDLFVNFGLRTASKRITLRSGHRTQADIAFEQGCLSIGGGAEIYVPYSGFNGSDSTLHYLYNDAIRLAKRYTPFWCRLSEDEQRIYSCACYIVLGMSLMYPVDVIICWTRDSKMQGYFELIKNLADSNGVRILNVENLDPFECFELTSICS